MPISTLILVDKWILIDFSACQLAITQVAYEAPGLFPSYTFSKDIAVATDLDKGAINKLLGLGINIYMPYKVKFNR